MTLGAVAGENVKIYFNIEDSVSQTVTGSTSTSEISTQASYYKEEHYGKDIWACTSNFYAKLVSVKPWYQPNSVRDTSTTIGTSSSPGYNRAYFNADEKLRTDMNTIGYNGQSMTVRSDTYQE